MNKLLAISWNPGLLRFVLGEARKGGLLRVLQAGERRFTTNDGTDAATQTAAQCVHELVDELKASKATLLLCLNRGSVDSVCFDVPPATDNELPVIVRNIAERQLSGLSDDSDIDFIAYEPDEDGSRRVCAMVPPTADQQSLRQMIGRSGCAAVKAIVITHPLRLFAAPQTEGSSSAALVVNKGAESAHVLVVQNGLPVLSRTIRLAEHLKAGEEADYIAAEVQRTLLSAGSRINREIEVSDVVVVGTEVEAATLVNRLDDDFAIDVRRVSARSLVDGDAGDASVGCYVPLIAALTEEIAGTAPAVDFANPRRPAAPANQRNRIIAAVAAVALLAFGGWYFVQAQFADIKDQNAALKSRLAELDELVKDTRPKRNLAKVLTAWEASRMSWLDELRDITVRMPSSPELTVEQFSAGSAGSGFVVSFRGTSRSPEAIRQMEESLRDEFHEPKTPGIREVKIGRDSVWTFQTTMPVRSRSARDFDVPRPVARSVEVAVKGSDPRGLSEQQPKPEQP